MEDGQRRLSLTMGGDGQEVIDLAEKWKEDAGRALGRVRYGGWEKFEFTGPYAWIDCRRVVKAPLDLSVRPVYCLQLLYRILQKRLPRHLS